MTMPVPGNTPDPAETPGAQAIAAHAHVGLGKLIEEAQKIQGVIEKYVPAEVIQAVEQQGLSFVETATGLKF